MKNFIKQNWFKVGFIFLLFAILISLFFFYNSYKKNNILISQEKCAQKAKEVAGNRNYRNHYNEKINKCFVLLETSSFSPNKKILEQKILIDAYENKRMAIYQELDDKDEAYCKIGENISDCDSLNKFVNDYMEEK
ncbi:MAG: hypothetical protein M0R20_04495 [Candidatus Omnitrophica bacterium]|jgi:uncharacterized protein YxeA|nr:hypothetical protein [Candidatus Omnitrophota bacterium]